MAHRIRVAEAAAERLAHRNARHLGLVDRIHHHEPIGVDCAGAGALTNAERVQCRKRVGPELDAGADLADRRRLLEHPHGIARARKRKGGREAADASTGDEDGLGRRGSHDRSILTTPP